MHRTRTALSALLLALVLAAPGVGLANTAEHLPDWVELVDGSLIRGWILERNADGSVLLQDHAGEVREIHGAAIRYAGPVEDRTLERPPSRWDVVEGSRVRVTLTDGHKRLEVHRVMASTSVGLARYDARRIMCSGECEATVPAGHHRLIVRRPIGVPSVTVRPHHVDLSQDSALHLDVRSRRGLRIATGSLGAGLLAAGSGVALAQRDNPDGERAIELGVMTALSGFVIALIGMCIPDRVRPVVTPLAADAE